MEASPANGGSAEDPADVADAEDAFTDAELSAATDDAFYRLLDASDTYDQMLNEGGVDCTAAERIVERICSLAQRVCRLSAATDDEDEAQVDQSEAECDDGLIRCARSEERLITACPSRR